MIKTKFFRSDTLGKLEAEVNAFLEEKRIVPHYVKIDYSAVVTGPNDILNTVMITYRTEGSFYSSESVKKDQEE